MEPMATRYYKPSGRVPLVGTLMMQFFGAAAAFLLGLGYAAANLYSPSIWLTGFAVCLFGAGVGFAVNLGARIGKVRNPGFILLIGLAAGLVALYAAWVLYIHLLVRRQTAGMLLVWVWNPTAIFEIMQGFAQQGIWTLKSWTPTGWALYAFWIAEACIVLGLTVVISGANDKPFCDLCNAWTKKEDAVASFALTDPAILRRELEDERYEILDTLHKQPFHPANCLSAALHTCPRCEESNFLTVSHVQLVVDGEGNETKQSNDLVKHLRVPYDVIEHVRNLGATPQEVPAEVQAEVEEEPKMEF